jgi:hypothetical protein
MLVRGAGQHGQPTGANSNTTLNAISADGPDDVWIVGTFLDSANEDFETFSAHFNGTAWTVVPSPSTGSVNDLASPPRTPLTTCGRLAEPAR